MDQDTAQSPGAPGAPSAEPYATDSGWPIAAGTTALSLPVPQAEALVSGWRARYDTAAAQGGAAHLTVLFPFLHRAEVDARVCATLGELFARHEPFEVRFERCGRFPGVLYLVPEPDRPVRALTEAVTEQWPEHRPYGGIFDGPASAAATHTANAKNTADAVGSADAADMAGTASSAAVTDRSGGGDPLDGGGALGGGGEGLDPHLTVANTGGELLHDRIAATLTPRLPITARITAVSLVEFDGSRWRDRRSFPLGGSRAI